ncbi:hypothetical protein Nepgr_014085 [Nepenthes gracilis]|uniref:ELM2 domain-containing protein n=1 Tax=Nepenthes gracilis TaxID=150966 RepID=A0AAD3SK86_NEPGR|nr:hypothetical protein Nepgr_014085 [Nepenthes gracilis]
MHKPRKRNRCSRPKSVDWLEYLNDGEPRLVVPVGPRFQADVPEWKGPCNEEFGRRGGANLDDSRWLGIRTWPIKGSCVGAEGGKIGKGRSDSCSCTSPGSSDCIKFHVAEERERLHSNLGPAFRSWKFDVMGEDVSKSWTMEQQKKFDSLVRMNPVSQGSSFLDPAMTFFLSKTRKDVVNYYLNVYLPKRISMKTHLGFKVLDSDDDEAGDATNDTNRPKRSRLSGLDVRKHVKSRYLVDSEKQANSPSELAPLWLI